MRGARAYVRISCWLRTWGAAHHPYHPRPRTDTDLLRSAVFFEALLVFLYVVVTRSSPGTGVTAAGGFTFGNHILVTQRQVPVESRLFMLHNPSQH
jgi:hypothetical protein